MTLKLDTLEIVKGYNTSNWQDFNLVGLDTEGKYVVIAMLSSYIGKDEHDLEMFKHTTVDNRQRNLENLKNYLQRNEIDNYTKWMEQPHEVRMKFMLCFNKELPCFSYNQR